MKKVILVTSISFPQCASFHAIHLHLTLPLHNLPKLVLPISNLIILYLSLQFSSFSRRSLSHLCYPLQSQLPQAQTVAFTSAPSTTTLRKRTSRRFLSPLGPLETSLCRMITSQGRAKDTVLWSMRLRRWLRLRW